MQLQMMNSKSCNATMLLTVYTVHH